MNSIEITNFASQGASAQNYTALEKNLWISKKDSWYHKARKDFNNSALSYAVIRQRSGVPAGVFDISFDKQFHEQRMNVIKRSKLSEVAKGAWTRALKKGHSASFLALLLSILPNLNTLLFGAGHILHYPLLFCLPDPMFGNLRPPSPNHQFQLDEPQEMIKRQSYLARILLRGCSISQNRDTRDA